MSEEADYSWRLEAQRRREVYLDRIRGNVERFCDRYARKLEEFAAEGLEQYAVEEFANIRRDIDAIDALLDSDPEEARELSFEVGSALSELLGLARSARREFHSREQKRRAELAEQRRQAASELEVFLNNLLSQISDPILLDFAYDDLRTIQAEYAGHVLVAEQLRDTIAKLEKRVAGILERAQARAQQWKAEKRAETDHEAAEAMVRLYKECAEASGDSGIFTAALSTPRSTLERQMPL